MRVAPGLLSLLAALLAAGCMQHDSAYVVDPATGQSMRMVASDEEAFPPQQHRADDGDSRALYGSPQAAQQEYAEPVEVAGYGQPQYRQRGGRGLFAARAYARAQRGPAPQQSYVVQYQPHHESAAGAPREFAAGGPYVGAPNSYAAVGPAAAPAYTLDAGDKLRVVVFGQDGISGAYTVDAGGNISMPLIGTVPARGVTTQHLAATITARLKQGYVREPHVTVSIETYRPFFILGEVTTPGQYPYVPNMTVETAVALAGGFAPRASKQTVKLTRKTTGQQFTGEVPLTYPVGPGDTIVVHERWF
jgi:polysaccharide export outer membrane protein